MLTDSFLDKQGGFIPISYLCQALSKFCIPLAGRGILGLRDGGIQVDNSDEQIIELELCIGLIFKPLRHHLKNVVSEGDAVLLSLWAPTLDALREILKAPEGETVDEMALQSTNELTVEHLRNIITVLIGYGVLKAEPERENDFTALTWEAISDIDSCKIFLSEWKEAALP
jgi:hypothetical protein